LLTGYFEKLKIPAKHAFLAMTSGCMTSTASLIWGYFNIHEGMPQYWFGIEPMYPGLILALLWWTAGWLKQGGGGQKELPV
jgi:hypothetical protein